MNEINILKLKNQGYCCSQIMVIMVLEMLDKDNSDLVRFSRGLCSGGGVETGTCGILTAGISIFAMYAGKEDERFALMRNSYLDFFQEEANQEGKIRCKDIAGDYYPESNPVICGSLLSKCYSQLISILVENGFDPADNYI